MSEQAWLDTSCRLQLFLDAQLQRVPAQRAKGCKEHKEHELSKFPIEKLPHVGLYSLLLSAFKVFGELNLRNGMAQATFILTVS